MQSPWSLFATHRTRPYAFFLDRTGSSSWSFAGSDPVRQLIIDKSGCSRRWEAGFWTTVEAHPLDAIETFVEESRVGATDIIDAPALLEPPTPLPRTVGYLGYELGAFIEDVAVIDRDPVGVPLAILSTYGSVDAWHPALGAPVRVTFATDRSDIGRASVSALAAPAPQLQPSCQPLTEDARLERYRAGFDRIKDAIRRGEIYQANLSRRIHAAYQGDPSAAYQRLRVRQPMPQGAYLDFGSFALLSNSPECYLRIVGDTVSTLPIKGTRPRHANPMHDRRAREELTTDAKELAEHVMIVDLERNDLGRICETGSVHVPTYADIHTFSTLHHLVSEVRGRLRRDCGLADVLRATFPGGSITGAPKIKAMEIIAEVEEAARGVYTGAIGCFNGSRSVELSIAIRTAIVADGLLHYCSGGGIVADSGLQSEYEETVTKARAFGGLIGETEMGRPVVAL